MADIFDENSSGGGKDFFGGKGCIFLAKYKGGGGFYSVQGLTSSGRNPVLIQSINSSDKDINLPITTLEKFKVLYRFGEDFGAININGLILLGPSQDPRNGVKKVNNWFGSNRLSNKKSPSKATLASGVGIKFYPIDLRFGRVDTEYHTQVFDIIGIVAEPPARG
jgi:hypothetical protein